MTGIEWTEQVWNPTTGCDRVSPGCDYCYALTMAARLKGMGQEKYQRDGDPRTSGPGFGITEHATSLDAPLHWRKPRKVFVNSMSDLFHAGVTEDFILRVFAVMAATPQHTYQILTKRHGRMRSLLNRPHLSDEIAEVIGEMLDGRDFDLAWRWPLDNVWLGVSVEDQKRANLRIPALLNTPAAVRFLSCEPLLGSVDLRQVGDLVLAYAPLRTGGIDWVIVGGESGTGARPLDVEWVRAIVEQCKTASVPVFVKQLGSKYGPSKGGDMATFPADLRVREFPTAVTA